MVEPQWWCGRLELSPLKRKVGRSNPSCDRPKSLIQGEVAQLSNAGQ